MEILAGAPLSLSLLALALLDGLSVGTLLIPVFLLLSPGRVRAGRILLYLCSIAVFYLLVGLLFLWGLVNLVDVARGFLASPAGTITRLVVGAGLLITALLIGVSSKKRDTEEAKPGRIMRWRDRLLAPETSRGVVAGVAIAAGLVEVATMLPYILGMTMLAEAEVDTPFRVLALVGYCVVMTVPALVLLVLRLTASSLITRPLERLAAWMERNGAEDTAWIIGIIGFLIAQAAAKELGLF